MLACIGVEIVFAGAALFWPPSIPFVVIYYCGRLIELVGVFRYLARSQQSIPGHEPVSGERAIGEWEESIRRIVREQVTLVLNERDKAK